MSEKTPKGKINRKEAEKEERRGYGVFYTGRLPGRLVSTRKKGVSREKSPDEGDPIDTSFLNMEKVLPGSEEVEDDS